MTGVLKETQNIPKVLNSTNDTHTSTIDKNIYDPNLSMAWWLSIGELTSNRSQIPPKPSTFFTSSGVREGLRDVAITKWPDLRAMNVRAEA